MPIYELKGKKPQIHSNTFIAENATIIGDVLIEEGASIWFNTVLRGDMNKIIIGKHSNIQDGCIIHNDWDYPAIVGDYVTVGHGVILHGCTIKDKALIGMGATILDGAEIGEGAIIGAKALVTANTVIPPNSLAVGTPAKVIKTLAKEQQEERIAHALSYEKKWQTLYK